MSGPGHQRHQALVVMVCCEVTAFAASLTAALMSDSLTLWASCLRVGLDLPASFFTLYVSSRLLRRQDGKFDYGLGKWENLAALINVPMLVAGLGFLGFRAVKNVLHPHSVTHTGFGLGVLAVFCVVNIILMRRFYLLNQENPSPLVHAQFVLYRNATAASLLSIAALLGARMTGNAGTYLDTFGALVLALLMIQSAILLLRKSLSALLDEAVEETLQTRIAHVMAGAHSQYRQFHRVRTRRSGDRIFIELFLEFDPDLTVRELSLHSQEIRQQLETAIPGAEITVIPCDPRS